jgi:hypothetical protein
MLECVAASKTYSIVGKTWLIDESAIHSLALSVAIQAVMCKVTSKASPHTAWRLPAFFRWSSCELENHLRATTRPESVETLAVVKTKENLVKYSP